MDKTNFKEQLEAVKQKLSRRLTLLERQRHASLFAFWRLFFDAFKKAEITTQASSLAFFFVFALFPFFIFVTIVLSRFSGQLETSLLWQELKMLLPPVIYEVLQGFFESLKTAKITPFASVGFLGLLWSSSKGLNLLFAALYRIYDRAKTAKRLFLQRVLAIAFLLLVTGSVLCVLFFLSYGNFALRLLRSFFGDVLRLPGIVDWLSYGFAFLYLSLLFALLFHLAGGKQKPFRYALAAASLTAALWLLTTFLFGYILAGQTKYSVIFGGLTGMLALMLWLYLCAIFILSGALLHHTLLVFALSKKTKATPVATRPHAAVQGEKSRRLSP